MVCIIVQGVQKFLIEKKLKRVDDVKNHEFRKVFRVSSESLLHFRDREFTFVSLFTGGSVSN